MVYVGRDGGWGGGGKSVCGGGSDLCLQKEGVERKKLKTLILAYQLRIRNPLLKTGFRIRIRIPKLAQNWADSGFWIPDPDCQP